MSRYERKSASESAALINHLLRVPYTGPAPTLTNNTLQRASFAASVHLNILYGPQLKTPYASVNKPVPGTMRVSVLLSVVIA